MQTVTANFVNMRRRRTPCRTLFRFGDPGWVLLVRKTGGGKVVVVMNRVIGIFDIGRMIMVVIHSVLVGIIVGISAITGEMITVGMITDGMTTAQHPPNDKIASTTRDVTLIIEDTKIFIEEMEVIVLKGGIRGHYRAMKTIAGVEMMGGTLITRIHANTKRGGVGVVVEVQIVGVVEIRIRCRMIVTESHIVIE